MKFLHTPPPTSNTDSVVVKMAGTYYFEELQPFSFFRGGVCKKILDLQGFEV